jgi:hypothetical protein
MTTPPTTSPTTSPDVKAGLLALTLGEAMARLHSVHDPLTVDPNWRICRTSTLCGEASRLLDDCELEMARRPGRREARSSRDRQLPHLRGCRPYRRPVRLCRPRALRLDGAVPCLQPERRRP